MSVFRRLLIPVCVCGNNNALDWTRCVCPRSEVYFMKIYFRGKQILRTTWQTVRAEAERYERKALAGLQGENAAAMMAALEGAKGRRTLACIGDIEDAYLDPAMKICKTDLQAKRNINDLFLVVAHGLDLWTIHQGGVRGRKVGATVPDKGAIRKQAASVLDGKLVKAYFAARSTGGVVDWHAAMPENRSINSTLLKARDVFRGKGALKLEELKVPDLEKFLKHPLLPMEEMEPEPLSYEQCEAMLTAWDACTDAQTRLINGVLRQTGMRSGSVAQLHSDWVRQARRDGSYWIDVRDRKGGTRLYSVPVSVELARLVLDAKGYVIEGATAEARADRVQAHNGWLKGVIGAPKKGQGNHRLRDTLATAVLSLYKMEVATAALGHEESKTTWTHYGRMHVDVPVRYENELRVFGRLRPGNVVPMNPGGFTEGKQGNEGGYGLRAEMGSSSC